MALETLLTFCPPAPCARIAPSSILATGIAIRSDILNTSIMTGPASSCENGYNPRLRRQPARTQRGRVDRNSRYLIRHRTTPRMHFDKDLDARGLNCPLPILRTKKALTGMDSG